MEKSSNIKLCRCEEERSDDEAISWNPECTKLQEIASGSALAMTLDSFRPGGVSVFFGDEVAGAFEFGFRDLAAFEG